MALTISTDITQEKHRHHRPSPSYNHTLERLERIKSNLHLQIFDGRRAAESLYTALLFEAISVIGTYCEGTGWAGLLRLNEQMIQMTQCMSISDPSF